MSRQEFDTLFGFTEEGHIQVQPDWLPYTFCNNVQVPQAPKFFAGQTKASHLKSKGLW